MENLIIKQKLEDATQYAYCAFRRFPKSERFVLVADLKRSLIRMLEMVIRANKSRDKLTALYNIVMAAFLLPERRRGNEDPGLQRQGSV